MPRVSLSEPIAAPADRVWAVIGDFGGLTGWLPAISACTVAGAGVGAVRTLGFVGSDVYARERLDAHDDAARSYTYSVVETDLPIAGYRSTIQVAHDGDGRCVLHWASSFDVTGGTDAAAIAGMIEQTYRDGAARIKALVAG